jgi:hypothetical protein
MGAVVMGIGMTMLEETIFDSTADRVVNATFGDYLIPVNADVPDLDVVFVGEPDRFNAIGIKGRAPTGVTNPRYRAARESVGTVLHQAGSPPRRRGALTDVRVDH